MRKNIFGLLSLLCMAPLASHVGVPNHVQEMGHSVSKSRQVISHIRLNALARIPLSGIEQAILVQGVKE